MKEDDRLAVRIPALFHMQFMAVHQLSALHHKKEERQGQTCLILSDALP